MSKTSLLKRASESEMAAKGDEVRANFTICQSCGVAIDREIADKRPSWQRGCPACRESLGGP